jgi:hypothetical protein
MALVGIRLDATREYQSKELDDNYGTPEAVVFKLGTLSSRVLVLLRDSATKFVPDPNDMTNVTAQFLPNHSSFETVRYGLKGWTNFRDHEGNDIPFKTVTRTVAGLSMDAVDNDTMDVIPIDLIRELAEEITRDNVLDEEKAKNSDE